jgi:hypothetical protein
MNDDHSKHAEGLVRQVWNNKFPHVAAHLSWDPLVLGIDESLADEIVCSLHPMPEEMAAALDWWRDKMVAAIDEIVQHYKNNPNPPLDC